MLTLDEQQTPLEAWRAVWEYRFADALRKASPGRNDAWYAGVLGKIAALFAAPGDPDDLETKARERLAYQFGAMLGTLRDCGMKLLDLGDWDELVAFGKGHPALMLAFARSAAPFLKAIGLMPEPGSTILLQLIDQDPPGKIAARVAASKTRFGIANNGHYATIASLELGREARVNLDPEGEADFVVPDYTLHPDRYRDGYCQPRSRNREGIWHPLDEQGRVLRLKFPGKQPLALSNGCPVQYTFLSAMEMYELDYHFDWENRDESERWPVDLKNAVEGSGLWMRSQSLYLAMYCQDPERGVIPAGLISGLVERNAPRWAEIRYYIDPDFRGHQLTAQGLPWLLEEMSRRYGCTRAWMQFVKNEDGLRELGGKLLSPFGQVLGKGDDPFLDNRYYYREQFGESFIGVDLISFAVWDVLDPSEVLAEAPQLYLTDMEEMDPEWKDAYAAYQAELDERPLDE